MMRWILTSSLLILAVLLIRAVGRDKLSARMRYALWGLVLVRLLMPFSIGESVLSVQNWLPGEQTPQVQTEPILIDELLKTTQTNPVMNMPVIPITETESSRTYLALPVLIWIVGSAFTGVVFTISNLRFAARLRRERKELMYRFVPVYMTDAVETPCLFGAIRPAIYVTAEVREDETALRHVLAHELTHYRHKDHIWSLLRCVCVSLHWFNPLVWVAAILSQKDAEMACDEGTLQQLGEHERTGYANTLLGLTCVGYKGMITAATSMTGSDSELKQRILRIVKNPKMSVAAGVTVLVVAAVAAVSVFSGAVSPKIEGLWQLELSYLGVGVDDPASAYMEYEFYNGRGVRTDHIGGEIRSAEWFSYIVDGENLELWFDGAYDPQTYTFTVTDETLTLNQKGREMTMTRMEQAELPFFSDGLIDIMDIYEAVKEESAQLTDIQSAQLLHLLRSGEITVMKDYVKNGIAIERYSYAVDTSQGVFTITDGVIFGARNKTEDGYVLSNMDEIEYWLQTLIWESADRKTVQQTDFVPKDLQGIVSARLIVNDRAYPADSAQLAFLEELLSTAEEIGYPTKCPFYGTLEVTLSDGRVLGVTPAMDSCSAFMIGNVCYEFGNQFATDDEGSYDNTALFAVFGLTPETPEEFIMSNQPADEGEVIGTNADIGDVVRVLNDVMEPAFLSIEELKTMQSLLWLGLGDAIGTEEVAWNEVYYSILKSDLPSKEDVVFLSDNGSLYMDGVRYEMSTAKQLLEQLDAIFSELRITKNGEPIVAVREAVGSTVYLELRGVPDDAEVVWTSEDETVCTVDGDAYGCTIVVTGGGVSNVKAEWNDGKTIKSDTVPVYCDRME